MNSFEERVAKLEEAVYKKRSSLFSWRFCNSEEKSLSEEVRNDRLNSILSDQTLEKIRQDAHNTVEEAWQKIQQERKVADSKREDITRKIFDTTNEISTVISQIDQAKKTVQHIEERIQGYKEELFKGENTAYYQSLLDDHTKRLEWYKDDLAKFLEKEETLQEQKRTLLANL